ncbi:MAG: hypothetical protein ACRDTD_23975 [Pseudonocardiaceae bacterium]
MTAMAPLAMSIMGGTASAAEQHNYAGRLIAAGERLKQRAAAMGGVIVEGEIVVDGSSALSAHTVEPLCIREQRL